MPVPPKRRSRSSKRERAAHFALKPTQLVACKNCKKLVLPHRVCQHCGSYSGSAVMATTRDKQMAKQSKAKKAAAK